MNLHELLSSALMYRLGWTLLHSLWQAAAVAGLLGLLVLLLRRRTPQVRYLAAVGAMTAVLTMSVLTFCHVSPPAPASQAQTLAAVKAVEPEPGPDRAPALPAPPRERGAVRDPVAPDEAPATPPVAMAPVRPAPAPAPAPAPQPWLERARQALQPYLPHMVAAWLLGVVALSLWRTGGWVAAMRLRVIGTQPAGLHVQSLARRLAGRLKLRRPVRILQSLVVQTPVVIGWLRPVVLLPLSAVTGLAPAQLEAILAHELAHIRRYDYLANLIQTAVETLFFYHPAVWWISRCLRLERERCCDDVAVEACGDRIRYAEALAAVVEVRGAAPAEPPARRARLAVGARGGSGRDLVNRIGRVIGAQPGESPSARWLAGAVVLGCLAVAGVIIYGCGAENAGSAATTPSPGTQSAADPNVRKWVKTAATPKDRAGMYAAMEEVKFPKAHWDKDLVQVAPPLSAKPADKGLEEWFAMVSLGNWRRNPNDDVFLLFHSRSVLCNDRMWIERVERDGNHFTIRMKRAIWRGEYAECWAYHSVYAVNLGKLPAGLYTGEWIIEPLEFTRFDKDSWPADANAHPTEKPITLTFSIRTASTTQPAPRATTSDEGQEDILKSIQALVEAVKRNLPENWEVAAVEHGRVSPLHWPDGNGWEIRVRRIGFKPEDWKRGLGGDGRLWIMDGDYAAEKPLYPDGVAQTGPAIERPPWHGRRVFAWGDGPGADKALQATRIPADVRKQWADLIARVRSGDGNSWSESIQELSQWNDTRVLPEMVAALKDPDVLIRRTVVCRLGELGDGNVAPALAQAAKDPDAQVRAYAVSSLSHLGGPGAFRVVEAALKDADDNVRSVAIVSVGRLRDPRSLDILLGYLKDPNDLTRRWTVEAIGELGDPRGREPLRAALQDKSEWVRCFATLALARLRDPSVYERLAAALKSDTDGLYGWAPWALGELGDKRAVEPLLALLDDPDVNRRNSAASALGKLGDRRAVEKLLEALKGKDYVRATAAEALGELGDPRAIEPLKGLLSDQDGYLREAASGALKKIREAATHPATAPATRAATDGKELVFPPGWDRKTLHGNLQGGLKRLADAHLPGYRVQDSPGMLYTILWKTKQVKVMRHAGKSVDSPVYESVEEVPADDGLIVGMTVADGLWQKKMAYQIPLPRLEAYLLIDVQFGAKCDPKLREMFSSPQVWLDAVQPATTHAAELTEAEARVLAARLVNEFLAGKEFKGADGRVLPNPTWTKDMWRVVEKKDGRWQLRQDPPAGWYTFVSFRVDGSDAKAGAGFATK